MTAIVDEPVAEAAPPRAPRRRGPRQLAAIVAGSVVIGAVCWTGGTLAAGSDDTKQALTAPTPSLVTARVERRTVVPTLSGRASIGYTDLTGVRGPAKGGRVTRLGVEVGDELRDGALLAEVDGRPVIAMAGPVPMYRPLVLGTSGDDVAEFERGLQRLGIDTGVVDATFDAATERAVGEFYRRAGSAPADVTPEQRAAYAAAKEGVTQAELKVLTDQHALDRDVEGPTPGELAQLLKAISDADLAVNKALRDYAALGPNIAAALAVANAAVTQTNEAAAAIQQQISSLPPGTDQSVRSGLDAQLSSARAAVDNAVATRDQIVRDRPGKIADALDATAVARTAADAARKALVDRVVSRDRALLRSTLEVSKASLVEAQRKLAEEAAVVGAAVPTGEIAFLPSLPRRVQRIDTKVGDDATGELLAVSGQEPVGRWFVADGDRGRLAVGSAVTLSDDATGEQLDGTIASIATAPGDPTADTSSDGATSPSGGGAPSSGTGGDATESRDKFLVTITIARTASTPPNDALVGRDLLVNAPTGAAATGLAVPLAALTSREDGSVRVRKQTADRDSVDVSVTVSTTGDGYALVVATGGTLAEGDRVVTGR